MEQENSSIIFESKKSQCVNTFIVDKVPNIFKSCCRLESNRKE